MRHARVVTRRSAVEVPADLRARLEAARLDLLALFRALDRMDLTPSEIPQRLIRQLFELDADYVEAVWALDQPPGALKVQAMLRDTLAALNDYRRPPRDSGRIFLRALIPAWPNWKSPFVRACSRPKPTAWSQAAIPRTVKHPNLPMRRPNAYNDFRWCFPPLRGGLCRIAQFYSYLVW
jgi:hypothetical protein